MGANSGTSQLRGFAFPITHTATAADPVQRRSGEGVSVHQRIAQSVAKSEAETERTQGYGKVVHGGLSVALDTRPKRRPTPAGP
jgi:hypothetical protein